MISGILGTSIGWDHIYLKFTTGELKPLFDILKGESKPQSKLAETEQYILAEHLNVHGCSHFTSSPQNAFGCGKPTAGTEQSSNSFYICTGTYQDDSLNTNCGYQDVYFCASWGCETTEDCYWKPSSSWDFITIHRGSLSSRPDCAHTGAIPWSFPLPVQDKTIAGYIKWNGACASMSLTKTMDMFLKSSF